MEDVKRYFVRTEDGYDDRAGNFGTIVLVLLVITGISIAFGLYGMSQYVKAVEVKREEKFIPFVIETDTLDGTQYVVSEISGEPMEYDELRDKSLAWKYVKLRMSWRGGVDYKERYEEVIARSSKPVGKLYTTWMNSDNGPIFGMGERHSLELRLVNVQLKSDGVAYVRYTTAKIDNEEGTKESEKAWTAIISFSYISREKMKLKDLMKNWTAFMVSHFTVEKDFL